ncbi:MAG TPA: response regulator [Acidimicrobiales bacterium]|nr:response regulator [Acidimicrobiales bacterium]
MPDDPSAPRLGPVARRLAATQRVLCVEDEPDIAAFLRAYFRAAGYDLVHIDPTDPDEVLAALDEHAPDCVLLDVRLRGFSGVEAYRRMRSDERWAFTPVIMVSAHASSDPSFRKPTGLDAFVAKPFNTNALADLVRERIDAGAVLAERGRDTRRELLSQDYLTARLADEIAVAGSDGHVSLAIARLRSLPDVLVEVGADGLDHLVRSLVDRARSLLPADTVLGATSRDEVAVLLPGTGPRDAYAVVRQVIAEVRGDFHFAGGAVVPVDVVAGLAAYPDNAADPDGLFMAADAALTDAGDTDALVQLAL